MKIKVKVELEQEVDIMFPAYFVYGGAKVCVIDQNTLIEVLSEMPNYERGIRIKYDSDLLVGHYILNGEPITKEDFLDEWESERTHLNYQFKELL